MSKLTEWTNKVICGDTLQTLKKMPDEFISCVIFSPPYWSLRDYKVEGQIGLEPTFDEWLAKMWAVMDEIRRVLRKDGTVWVNLGDTYASGGGLHVEQSQKRQSAIDRGAYPDYAPNAKLRARMPKSLLMLPERFALGCIKRDVNDEYELRNDLTEDERNYVLSELKHLNVDGDKNHNDP